MSAEISQILFRGSPGNDGVLFLAKLTDGRCAILHNGDIVDADEGDSAGLERITARYLQLVGISAAE